MSIIANESPRLTNVLPYELVESILKLIPFPQVCKLRSVSKVFDAIVSSESFALSILVRIIDPEIVSENKSG
ncbi:hypothetical protein HK100_002051, partial [Physocladia obscura]